MGHCHGALTLPREEDLEEGQSRHDSPGLAGQPQVQQHMRRLGIAFAILLAFVILEFLVGWSSGSLGLLSDAGHMLADVIGVAIALLALSLTRRAARVPAGRAGSARVEALATLFNAALLGVVAAFVLYESIHRFLEPTPLPGHAMMFTALAGLVANIAVFVLLRRGAADSMVVRSAYLEVLADTLGSVGVLLAGILTWTLGWNLADPLVAVAIGLFVLPRAWTLGQQALTTLRPRAA